MSSGEEDEVQLPNLGDEPIAQKLRRYVLALLIAIGIVISFAVLVVLVLAIVLPWVGDDMTDPDPEDIIVPDQEEAQSLE